MENITFATDAPLSVSALNRCVRTLIETAFPLIWVSGEISNLTFAASGHIYFSLKDDSAQVRCVAWRQKAQLLGWRPQNGERVDVRALVTLYEPRGDYQLNVETIQRAGQGALFQRFIELKNRLASEGLFDSARKRPLPAFPRRIGIVTSPQAAALHDVLTTLRRRAPHILLTLYPTPVQGEGAAAKIAAALAFAARHDNDLIILCRGGGSIEDLWSFNEEVVARALGTSPIPVISGVGHETDVTIADFAADHRAPTPTAAAEMASPERDALLTRLSQLSQRLSDRLLRHRMDAEQRVDWLASRLIHPQQRLQRQATELSRLEARMRVAFARHSEQRQHRAQSLALRLGHAGRSLLNVPDKRLNTLETGLRQLNPLAVLERGYAMVQSEKGSVVRDSTQLNSGDILKITLAHGQCKARVTG